jgi:outer membrane autotransporter protein
MNRIGKNRKAVLLGGSAVALALFASSAAQAQCVGSVGAGGGAGGVPPVFIDPIAAGAASSVNSLISVLNTTTTAFLNQTNAFIGAPPNPAPGTMGGGVWHRGIGGRIDTNSTGIATVDGAPGDVTCNTTTRTEFAGYQGGVDIARLNVGGWNVHGGVTAGYVEMNAQDRTPGQGSFSGQFQVPFVGIYGAATLGGFFIDAQLRGDFFQNSVTDPVNGVFGQNFNSRGIAFSANAGYNHNFGNGWFIEPSAGFVWSRVENDPLNISGSLVLLNSPLFGPPGTLQIGDVDSLLGRLSLRVGTNFNAGNFLLQPFVTGSILHEFADDVQSTYTTCFGALDLGVGGGACGSLAPILPEATARLSSSRVGTYGQFAAGMAALVPNTGWLGYVRADYRTGDNIEGWSLNGGLRYQFNPEFLAPAPVGKGVVTKAPPVPVVAPYNWTGFYVGTHIGTTWGDFDAEFGPLDRVSPEFGGAVSGVQVGFNYQMGSIVFGLEADGAWSNARGARPCPDFGAGVGFFFTCDADINSLFTFTGRIGVAYERALFYVKGGVAAGEVDAAVRFNPGTQPLFTFVQFDPGQRLFTGKETQTGFTVGGGFEFGITKNVSAKAEYLYYNLGTDRFDVSGIPVDVETTGNLVRLGVNYRFTGLPFTQ